MASMRNKKNYHQNLYFLLSRALTILVSMFEEHCLRCLSVYSKHGKQAF